MNKAKKIKTEEIGDISLSICKTTYFYDVVVESSVEELKKIKERLDIDSGVIEEGVYGNSILILETCDTEEDAEQIFEDIKERIWNVVIVN